MKMRKLLIIVILALFASSSCEESVDYNIPEISDSDKTLNIILDNVPLDYLGEDIYFFIISNQGIYSLTEANAVEDTTITLLPPDGSKAFDIVAFIPYSDSWQAGDNFSTGYYSAAQSIQERESHCITQSWYYSGNLNYNGLTNTTIFVQLNTLSPSYNQGDIIDLDATITPILNSPINTVKYYLDNSEIITYNEKPYTYALNTIDINPGTHNIKVVVTNDEGHTAENKKEIYLYSNENGAPVVNITSHNNGDNITHGNYELIYANISDPENNISKVEFKINNTLVETITEGAYEYLWETLDNNIGTNTITVTAYDEDGASRSDIINVNLVAPVNYTPQVRFTSPSEGIYFTQGDLITVSTSVFDMENDIAYVEYYIDENYIGYIDQSPFSFTWDSSSSGLGSHTFRAVIWDNYGLYSEDEVTFNIQ